MKQPMLKPMQWWVRLVDTFVESWLNILFPPFTIFISPLLDDFLLLLEDMSYLLLKTETLWDFKFRSISEPIASLTCGPAIFLIIEVLLYLVLLLVGYHMVSRQKKPLVEAGKVSLAIRTLPPISFQNVRAVSS